MKLDKEYLKKLILESFQEQQFDGGKRISPIGQNVDTNQVMKQNISQQLRILKFMQETLKDIQTPTELQNMISQIQKSKTSDFLKQVLNIDETIPIKVSSILENPLELLQAIMGEIIKVATEKGNKKITKGTVEESEIKYYIREPEARLEKHKKKIKTPPPPPVLKEDWESTKLLGKAAYDLMNQYGVKNVSVQKDPKNVFRIGYFKKTLANSASKLFAGELKKLLPDADIQVKSFKNDFGNTYLFVLVVLPDEQITEDNSSAKLEIEKLEKKGKKYQELASKRWDQNRNDAAQMAMNMAHQYFNKANALRIQHRMPAITVEGTEEKKDE